MNQFVEALMALNDGVKHETPLERDVTLAKLSKDKTGMRGHFLISRAILKAHFKEWELSSGSPRVEADGMIPAFFDTPSS